jgi:hypothetical protein
MLYFAQNTNEKMKRFFAPKIESVFSSTQRNWHSLLQFQFSKTTTILTTKSAPPVADDESGVSHAAIVAPTTLGSPDCEDFVDNYNMLTNNNDQHTSPLVHHCGGAILPIHWTACKAVLSFHAGTGVS